MWIPCIHPYRREVNLNGSNFFWGQNSIIEQIDGKKSYHANHRTTKSIIAKFPLLKVAKEPLPVLISVHFKIEVGRVCVLYIYVKSWSWLHLLDDTPKNPSSATDNEGSVICWRKKFSYLDDSTFLISREPAFSLSFVTPIQRELLGVDVLHSSGRRGAEGLKGNKNNGARSTEKVFALNKYDRWYRKVLWRSFPPPLFHPAAVHIKFISRELLEKGENLEERGRRHSERVYAAEIQQIALTTWGHLSFYLIYSFCWEINQMTFSAFDNGINCRLVLLEL